MKQLVIFLLLVICSVSLYSQDLIQVYGRVTDFNDNPIDSVTIRLKNKNFENLYETLTDKDGLYSITVEKKLYYSLYAIKTNDYGKTKLEYWAWNVPAYNDLEINPKYDRMEIYGINAFEPQVSPHETYMIYFRPMSLTKSLEFQGNKNKKDIEKQAASDKMIVDIAPSTILEDELMVKINELKAEVVDINKITEYARGAYMYGYQIQIKKPKENEKLDLDYDKISIQLHSKETDEYGLGEYFIKRIK